MLIHNRFRIKIYTFAGLGSSSKAILEAWWKKKKNDRGAYIFFGNELEHFKMRKSFHNLAYTGLKLGITEWVHHQMIQGIKLSGLKKKER